MSADSLDCLENSNGGVIRLLRDAEWAVLRIEDLGSDPLDGGTDHRGLTISSATTKVRKCGGDGLPSGFVGGMGAIVGVTDVLP